MNPYFSLAQDWINTIDVDTFVMEYSSVQVETDDTVLLFFFLVTEWYAMHWKISYP